MQTLKYILQSFRQTRLQPGDFDFDVTDYEVCSVVMETGFHDVKTLLFQDKDLEFWSTSDAEQINFAHPAYLMLDSAIAYFDEEQKKCSMPLQEHN